MIDKKFKEVLSKHEFVVIPTDGVMDMWQDELGLVRMTVGVGKSNQENGNMLIFCDHDSFYKAGGEDEFGEGYKTALKDVHSYLLNTYQSAFTWDDINAVLQHLDLGGKE